MKRSHGGTAFPRTGFKMCYSVVMICMHLSLRGRYVNYSQHQLQWYPETWINQVKPTNALDIPKHIEEQETGNPWKRFANELNETIPVLHHINFHHQNGGYWFQVAHPGLPTEVSWPSFFSAMWLMADRRQDGETLTAGKKPSRYRYASMESMFYTWCLYLFSMQEHINRYKYKLWRE